MVTMGRLRYLVWAASRILGADTSCPACSESRTELLRRKYVVTSLYRCPTCEVMFRVPKSSPEECAEFYQNEYHQGFTTDCPGTDELAQLIEHAFKGSEKDYSTYISVLRSVPVAPGGTILDFGCSWGYGSWQMRRAGYVVYSFELSRPRARYAAERLDCIMCRPEDLAEKVDCFFASHVIEHLPNPRVIWETARDVVKPGGNVVLFLPNGEPERERLYKDYHRIWGQVHPLLLSPKALMRMGQLCGFDVKCYSTPYSMQEIRNRTPATQTGDELLVVATRRV